MVVDVGWMVACAKEGVLASGWASSLYRFQRVYREMISWDIALMRGRETDSSERKVMGSCWVFFSFIGGVEDVVLVVLLRLDRRGFCGSSWVLVEGEEGELEVEVDEEEERRGVIMDRVGLCRMNVR
jgi:hypothetical protein